MDSGNSQDGAFPDSGIPSVSPDSKLDLTSPVKKKSTRPPKQIGAVTTRIITNLSNFREIVQHHTGFKTNSSLSPSLVEATTTYNSSSHHGQSLDKASRAEASFHGDDQVATPEPMEEAIKCSFQSAEASEKNSIYYKKPRLGNEFFTDEKCLDLLLSEAPFDSSAEASERSSIYYEKPHMGNECLIDEKFTDLMFPDASLEFEMMMHGSETNKDLILSTDDKEISEVDDGILLCVERDTNARPTQGMDVEGSTEIPEGEEWLCQEIRTTVLSKFLVLPDSPNCPYLVTLSLEGSKALMDIPSSFFEHMPVLKRLNLSQTSIRSLPVSLFKVVSLRELIMRHCKLFFELSPEVGKLQNLEVLDLDGTEIVDLPKEIKNLSALQVLRLSFDGCMNARKQMHQSIFPETIRSLSQLVELSIDVNPDDEGWNAVVEVVVEEACSLERLTSLALYLPNIEIWEKCRTRSKPLSYYQLPRFRFIIGPHKRRIISRVPAKIESQFQEWDKCLKFVKGNGISSEMKNVVRNTKAFYLDRHASARSLFDFGIKNLQNLEFCLVTECDEIVRITDECNNESHYAALSKLQYLHIYYLKNLVSIWRSPTNFTTYLSGLKILSLHMCPKLDVVFSPFLVHNLCNLEELVIKDCPEVTCVVSGFTYPTSNVALLPKFRRMVLMFLPKLVSISSGLQIAPKLEEVVFYDCPELKSLSAREIVSGENLKVIKGESYWWDALELDESEWGSQLDHLRSVFSPIEEDDEFMNQMEEI